jgi:putative Mg2+ transporter-C (MgtC) family protein
MLSPMLKELVFPAAVTASPVLRLLLAAVLGGLIGLERDIHGRAAGLRTNLLVCLGAALFMLISLAVAATGNGPDTAAAGMRSDPGRIAAQIITGIGFLGAGAIIKSGFSVHGLTTAACLWLVAGIGMAAGAGYFELALVVTAVSLLSLLTLNRLERLFAKDTYRILEIMTSKPVEISTVTAVIRRPNLKILHTDFEQNRGAGSLRITLTLRVYQRGAADALSESILRDLDASGIPILSISWQHS